MGIGRITQSAHPALPIGGRYFGFFPMADHHVVDAKPNTNGFIDMSEHRGKHAGVYRSFSRVESDVAYDPVSEGRYLITRAAASFLLRTNTSQETIR